MSTEAVRARSGVLDLLAAPQARSRALRVGAVVAAFGAWEVAARLVDSALMPPLPVIVGRLGEDVASGLLWEHASATFLRGFSGLAIALVVGVALGMAMGLSPVVRGMFEPILAATYPVPKLALYPFFILLLGFGAASKVALVALETVYPISYNVFAGVSGMDRRLLWVAGNFRAGRLARWGVVARAALPSLLAGLRIAVPITLIVVVVTELIGESLGLGFLIRSASTNFEPEGSLAVILFLGVVGFALDRLLLVATRRLVFWQPGLHR